MTDQLLKSPVAIGERRADIFARLEAYSRELSGEATHYWTCHAPRYRYLAGVVKRLSRTRSFRRVLDVGMGFETLLLRDLLPGGRIECLGLSPDHRFIASDGLEFHALDLNDVALQLEPCATLPFDFELIVFMEVLEHLYIPPELVLRYLASHLAPGGILFVTTPNAAWLKNRIKLACGRNPFELLRPDRKNMGHVREYTKQELEAALQRAGLRVLELQRLGLYRFRGRKDRVYSALADRLHPSLARSLVALCEKPAR